MLIKQIYLIITFVFLESLKIKATDMNLDDVTILTISMQKDQEMSSLIYPTTIYMKVLGLDPLEENNEVWGTNGYNNYLFQIQTFDFDQMSLSCSIGNYASKQDRLAIQVKVQGKQVSKCTFAPLFCVAVISSTYKYLDQTYFQVQDFKIQFLSPLINYGNKELILKIDSTNFYGKANVGIYQYNQNYLWETIGYFKQFYEGFSQNISQQQFYVMKFYDHYQIYPILKNCTYRIAPIITNLSKNKIIGSFTNLSIKGSHFTTYLSQQNYIKVFIGGQENQAKVLNYDNEIIQVQLPNLTDLFQQQIVGQKNQYLSGTGFFYTLYNISDFPNFSYSVDNFRETLINKPDALKTKIEFDGIHPALDCFVSVPYNYGQYFRGFLSAPITGNFTFFLASTGNSSLHISLQNFTILSNSTPFVRSQNAIQRFYWFNNSKNGTVDQVGQISTIYLEKGNYYYLEIFNIGSANKDGVITLSLQYDDLNNQFQDPYSESVQMSVISLNTSYDAVKEIIGFKIYNNKDNLLLRGSYKLQFKQQIDSDLYYTTTDISLQSLPQDIIDAIQSTTPYLVSITAQKIDKEAQILTDDSTVFAGYFYQIIFDSYRDEKFRSLPEFTSVNFSAGFTYNVETSVIQQPKGPIYGTFDVGIFSSGIFEYPKIITHISYDNDLQVISDWVASRFQVKSKVYCMGRAQDGRTCYFQSQIYFQFSLYSFLQSDSSNVTLSSKNEYYGKNFQEPMAMSMVYTYYDTPQLQVSLYNTIIGCEIGQCSLDLNINNIYLSNFTLQDSLLQLNLIPPQGCQINQNDLTVKFAGSNCEGVIITELNETYYSLQCELEKLNGKPIREAGSNQLPLVSHNVYGYGVFSHDTAGLETQLIIDSISPTTGSPYGGTLVTLKGSGFPKDLSSNFLILFANQYLLDSSRQFISNQEIQFTTNPQVQHQPYKCTVVLQVNNKSAKTNFTFSIQNTYAISSFEMTDLPQFTETIKLFGSNLGDSIEDVTIIIKNKRTDAAIKSQAQLVSVTPTEVVIYIKDLLPGNCSIQYCNAKYGYFQYSINPPTIYFIVKPFQQVYLADEASLPQISLSGGALIKIAGLSYKVNNTFIKINQYICQIDYELSYLQNIFCKLSVGNQDSYDNIKSINVTTYFKNGTSKSITVEKVLLYNTTQTPLLQNYPLNITNQDQKDYELVTSMDAWSPQIERSQRSLILINSKVYQTNDVIPLYQFIIGRRKLYKPGDVETLVGVQILGKVWVRFEGPKFLTVEAEIQDNTITYAIPNLPQGDYSTFIYTQNGNVDKKWITEIPFNIDNISEIYYGGARININGTGFNLDQKLRVTVNNQECENIEVIDYHQLYCDYKEQNISDLNVFLQQISLPDNDLILQLNQSKSISQSNYFLDSIKINNQEQTIGYKRLEAITGLVQISVSGQFDENGTLKLNNAFINPISSNNNYEAIFEKLPIGQYQIQVQFKNQSAEIRNGVLCLNVLSDPLQNFSIDQQQYQSSFSGGRNISINGFGFGQDQIKATICDFYCEIKEINFTSLVCEVPKIQNEILYKKYPILSQAALKLTENDFQIISGNQYYLFKLFDQKQSTYYQPILSSDGSDCSILFNTTANKILRLQQLRFSTISNSTLDYSSLNFSFQDLDLNWHSIDFRKETQKGWNTFNPPFNFPQIKAIKLTDSTVQSKSACQISEIEIYGWIYGLSTYNDQSDSITCDVNVFADGNLITSFKNSVIYSNLVEVTNVSPQYGEISAQEVITIIGSGFIIDKTIVLIDSIECNILTLNANLITCQTGIKDITKIQISGTFEVKVDGSKALVYEQFFYIQRWSNPSTWGDGIPQNQSSLIIDQNQTILFDVSYLQMQRLIIDGTLIFSDEFDIFLQLDHFIINQGKLVIGTERNPHQHQVQINLMYFDEKETKLKLIGFKGITCYQCQLDFHGKEKSPSWTVLNKNAMKDDQTIQIMEVVNWIVGDQIMLSSSNIGEIEYRVISSVSKDQLRLTLDMPLNFDHLISENYSVEIAIIGRNIQIIGSDYVYGKNGILLGFHFKIIGSQSVGTKVRISNTEFSKGGQVNQNLYYPIYFQSNQNLKGSYLIGNYFHDNAGPCVAIENTFNLLIQQNVLINNDGHGIFLVTGKEINNIIDRNLVQGIFPTSFYKKSAAKPAAFWISNSQNKVIRNRAIGSQGIGFYLQINSNQFCYNETFISGFEENLARQIQSYSLLIDIIPSKCQNQTVMAQVIKSFYSWNNKDADLLILAEMQEQYHKAKFFFNYTENFGVFLKFAKDFYISEFSAVFQVNYTQAQLFNLIRRNTVSKKQLSLKTVPNFENCQDGQWYNDKKLKVIYVCSFRLKVRVLDELMIFATEPYTTEENEFFGSSGACENQIYPIEDYIEEYENANGNGGSNNNETNTSSNGTDTGTGSNNNETNTGSNGTDTGNGSGGSNNNGTNIGTGSGGNSSNGTNTSNNGTETGDQENCSETEDADNNIFKWSNVNAWPNKSIPNEGEDVVINKDKTIYLDISPPKLRFIKIFGVLIVKQSLSQKNLSAYLIDIQGSGKMFVGDSETLCQGGIVIKLGYLFNFVNGIQMISNTNLTIQTRITKFAKSSTNTIQVSECQGWKVGDIIVISTSSPDPAENEKKVIIGIQNCLIIIKDPLQFDHYGASDTTLKKNDIGELDMRTVVLHLSRKIKIQGLDNHCLIEVSGTTILQGVEFENCAYSDNPGIQLLQRNNNDNDKPTLLLNCSFHDFGGKILKIDGISNLIIKNNVFFKGLQQLVEITNYKKIKFNNNVLVYVQKNEFRAWAALGNFIDTKLQKMSREEQDFSQNIGVASEDAGFYIISQSCSQFNSSSFYNIQCSSAAHSCFVIKEINSTCDYIGQLSVSNSQIGIMYVAQTEQLIIENIVAAENKINVIIKGRTEKQINNQIKFSNSYITALARPECSECYQTISQIQNCQNSLGMQMVTISSHTYSLIQDNFTSNQYDLITSNERLDVRVFITNVIFDNFKLQYESFPLCQFNSVFRQHPQAYDVTGRHYLINSTCINCDFDALLYKFRDSDYSQIGVYGGCGSMECTGMKNSLISDETVEFFGEISQAIGNNSYFGQYKKDSCSYQKEWNGYWCKGLNIQVLNFMSIATDYAVRVFSPIKFVDNNTVFNTLNSFYKWSWEGRESKFAGVTPKNKSISINVATVNPTSSQLWLSSNSQSTELDYQIIQWQFQESLVIQVNIGNQIIQPGITKIKQHYDLYNMTNQCGANNFFNENRTIHFILTNEDSCVVTISLRYVLSVSTTMKTAASFDADQFMGHLSEQFGGFPYNYYIFSIKRLQRRFLAEQESIVEIQWGFVETNEVGTEQAKDSIQKLEELAEKLPYIIFPDDIGTLISQFSNITQLLYQNYPSSEEQPQKNNTQSDQSQNSNNNNGNSNNNSSTNSTNNNNNEEEEFNPVENESVNIESPSSNNQTVQQTGNQIKKEQNQKDYTLTIVLAVVLPIVGVAIIVGIIFYIRKKKPDRQILYTCTTSAAEITARAHNVNAHSKKLSIATPAVKEENALAPQNNLEQIQ